MIITNAELYRLEIPFNLSFSHSKAVRFFSDSVILKIRGKADDNSPLYGWGEAVIRDYVTGSIGGSGSGAEAAAEIFKRLLAPFRGKRLTAGSTIGQLVKTEPAVEELPLLCAVETALLDMLCRNINTDIYNLLGRPPERDVIVYGGTLPIMPQPDAEKLLNSYNKMGISSLRIKMDGNTERNEATVRLARRILGQDYDLRIDANAGWTVDYAAGIIPFLKDEGISIIEEPFGRISPGGLDPLKELMDGGKAGGMTFMADESALTVEDIRKAAIEGTFSMINIRLAKNGGILRALSMAEEAEKLGIRYQAGCHVGETGILSAAGRAAASIMKKPEYTGGSYDSHLLSGNITTEDMGFGAGGRACIITGKGLGFRVDEEKLKGFTDEKLQCF